MRTPADRARAYRIFSDALERTAAELEQFLERACQGDATCRAEVEALLRVAREAGAPTQAFLRMPQQPEEDLSGRTYGRFRLIERIGTGGMGVVYRAERTDGVQQSVAIKLVSTSAALASPALFEREAQLLARLEHPAVARLIDAGLDAGQAWIAMEFVRGVRIDEYCAAHRLSSRAILSLLIPLADAVAAAHRMLVVHSDIKPANVLVTVDGAPKLIDFGISTALRDAGAETAASGHARRVFTPGFAAPEQVSGGPLTVATDVYGLGALAYRLLSGVAPFPDALDPAAYMQAVSQREVIPPSRAALAGQGAPQARALRGDLDAIVCKALERDAARRYSTAADMRADLLRFLEGRPVAARAASPLYRLTKFARRNALAVSLSGLLLLSLAGGGLFAAVQAHRAATARDQARAVTSFLTHDILAAANPLLAGTRDVQLRPLLDDASKTLQQRFQAQPTVLAEVQAAMGAGYAALFETAKAETLLTAAESGLARELGDSDAETQSARSALWYLYTGNVDVGKLYKLSARILAAEDAVGRHDSALAYRARLMLAWIPCVAKAPEAIGLSNCGDVVRPFYVSARAHFGPEDLTTYEMAWFLGVALIFSSREDEAEPVLRDACLGLQHHFGEVHHRVTECRRYLAKALDKNGKSADAERLLDAAAQIFDKTLGSNSQFTAISNYERAAAALHNGHLTKSLDAARLAVQEMQQSPGSDQTDLWRAQLLLANVLVQAGRSQEGLPLGEQAFARATAALGANAGPLLRCRDLLAQAYLRAGNAPRAEALLRENLALGAQLRNRPAWLVGQLEASLAGALLAEQKPAAAEPLLRDAVPTLLSSLGPHNARTIAAAAQWRALPHSDSALSMR
jgi:eukaryotic-like serine/threonine-protein kinase